MRIPFAWIGLVAATALVVVLAQQNRALRAEREWLVERSLHAYEGMWLPQIAATDLDGASLTLGTPTGDAQVLYFFTTHCPYCRRSSAAVSELAATLVRERGVRAQLIGVSLDDAQASGAYARTQGFDFPIAVIADRRTLMLFRAREVPLLLVVGRDGRVRHRQLGAIDTREEVESVLAAVRGTDATATVAVQKEFGNETTLELDL